MGHSRKKTPIFKYIGNSNKLSKRFCNRKFRKQTRIAILKNNFCPVRLDEVMTEYEFHGDGKQFVHSPNEKYLRK